MVTYANDDIYHKMPLLAIMNAYYLSDSSLSLMIIMKNIWEYSCFSPKKIKKHNHEWKKVRDRQNMSPIYHLPFTICVPQRMEQKREWNVFGFSKISTLSYWKKWIVLFLFLFKRWNKWKKITPVWLNSYISRWKKN